MPFHRATANMAALLRSARVLKFSPSGLLQITGTKRNGPPLSRLYSGAAGGCRTGTCSRQVRPAAENASRRAWPYAAGCVRNYAVATERDEASTAVRSRQIQEFDWALSKLDSAVRRTGRITKSLLLRIFHDICRTGYPSANQALLLLRSCGSLLPEVPLQERTELAHRVWDKLQSLGAHYDVSHYNALLKVYLQNEFKFSPMDFLAKMEAANVTPNRVTYQRLITTYCQNGDIEGASTILGFMKSKDLPITEVVFNSLLTGHARAGDIESAKNIMTVMRGAGIEPGPDTYVSLLHAYAEKGDLESVKKTLEEADSADCSLMDRDILQVILTLAKAGHQQHVPEMIQHLKHERGYVPDAINLCLTLITLNLEDTAFHILKTFPSLQSENLINDNNNNNNVGNFFLRHCVNMDTPMEKFSRYCKELQESNLHSSPLTFALLCALEAKKTDMSLELMKMMKEQDLPLKPHYFWPLFNEHLKNNNTAGAIEVLKGMQALGVDPDSDTLSIYVLRAFPDMETAGDVLKEVGVSLETNDLLCSKVRSVAATKLDKCYALLSDPSFPTLELSLFRSSLTLGFKRSSDVETMVKIVELLLTDKRFTKANSTPAEDTSFFVYNFINSMTKEEIIAQEDKLRKFFNQLQAQNITFSSKICRGIRNLLDPHPVPELIKDVMALTDPKDQLSNGSAFQSSRPTGVEGKMFVLEKKLAEAKAENKPKGPLLKQLIFILCSEENLQRALELKQEHEEDMTISCYVSLLHLCCRLNNVEEALNLKRELNRKDSSAVMDTNKYIALIKVLSENDKLEEAVDILKEMKEKVVVLNDGHVITLAQMLGSAALKSNIPAIQRLLETIFTLGLAKPSISLCSPLVSAHLDRDDLAAALDATLECQKNYNHMPNIHEIIVGLVDKGETALLQKAMDFVSQKRGEMTMLYDLFFAFLQTGRYREARKVIETPGLRAKSGRLHWYAERCISSNNIEALEQMVDMTAKLFECDRDEMYSYIFRLCKETNNWEKAVATWTKMQEENIIPRERTLRLLADILKSNGQEVPFEEPETWYKESALKLKEKDEEVAPKISHPESGPDYQVRLIALCKKGKCKEAFELLQDLNQRGLALKAGTYDHLIRFLLAEGAIEDAMRVKDIAVSHISDFSLGSIANSLVIITQSKRGQPREGLEKLKSMLEMDQLPSQLAITRLIQGLGNQGDVSGIQEVQTLLKNLGQGINLSSMVFTNNMALAHIKNGDVDAAVESFEAVYTGSDSANLSMAFVFRKLMENGNDTAIDKLSAMAERLANHFACYRPALDLFLVLMDMDKVEDAKFMLARCNAVAEQTDALLSFSSRMARIPGQAGKIKNLMNLIPDFTEKDVMYTYLMKSYILDKDLPSAKALYEQMQKEERVIDELSLKRLAVLYKEAGETAPFPEPPESFKFYADKLKASKETKTAEE